MMDSLAFTAYVRLNAWEAQALVRTWFHELGLELAYAEGDLLIAWLEESVTPSTRVGAASREPAPRQRLARDHAGGSNPAGGSEASCRRWAFGPGQAQLP